MADAPLLRFLAPVVFMALVIAHAEDRGPLSSLMSSRPLQWLGQLSYSIYLSHLFVVAYVVPRLSLKVDRFLPNALAGASLWSRRSISVSFSCCRPLPGATSNCRGSAWRQRIAASIGRRQTLSSRYSRSQLEMTRL